jgi:autophagy-related protein 13
VPDSPDFQGGTPGSAVGALVRILKGAAPLRQQSAPPAFADLPVSSMGLAPSSPVAIAGQASNSPPKRNCLGARNTLRVRPSDLRQATSLGGNGATAGTSFGTGGIGSPPSIGVRQASSKSAADALEELRQYREMRDFLVRQSGGNSVPGQQAV